MPRGRPAKKPGYDREAAIQKLIDRVVELAVEPFDEDEDRDDSLPTMTEIAKAMQSRHDLTRMAGSAKIERMPTSWQEDCIVPSAGAFSCVKPIRTDRGTLTGRGNARGGKQGFAQRRYGKRMI